LEFFLTPQQLVEVWRNDAIASPAGMAFLNKLEDHISTQSRYEEVCLQLEWERNRRQELEETVRRQILALEELMKLSLANVRRFADATKVSPFIFNCSILMFLATCCW
jgi:hypothetical protein